MSTRIDANALVPLRPINYVQGGNTPITTSTPQEVTLKAMLVAAFSSIPNQGGATATVGAIVTALNTLP